MIDFNYKIIITIIIILLLIIFYYIFIRDTSLGGTTENFDDKKYIQGLWEGMPEFCNQADLDNMILYIGDIESGNKYNAYFIISNKSDNGNTGIMKKILIKFEKGYAYIEDDTDNSNNDILESIGGFEIDSSSLVNINDIMPSKLKFEINHNKGQLTLSDHNKVWAHLYKNTSV